MLDAHAHVMRVKLCKANTQGVTAVVEAVPEHDSGLDSPQAR